MELERPDCPLLDCDGNIFVLLATAKKTLRENGLEQQAEKMEREARSSENYDDALGVLFSYVNPVNLPENEGKIINFQSANTAEQALALAIDDGLHKMEL